MHNVALKAEVAFCVRGVAALAWGLLAVDEAPMTDVTHMRACSRGGHPQESAPRPTDARRELRFADRWPIRAPRDIRTRRWRRS